MGTYDPLTGEGYDRVAAMVEWSKSMHRSMPAWSARGRPGGWFWTYFNFQPYQGKVTVEDDGFHWQTTSYDEPERVLHSGVTTSLFEAYQSVVRNEPVSRDELSRA